MTLEKNELGPILAVGLEIYKANIDDDPIWFTKLTDKLKPMKRSTVNKAMDILNDLGLVEGGYQNIEGKFTYTLKITDESNHFFKVLYEKFTSKSKKN